MAAVQVFCVQAFKREGESLVAGDLRQYTSATEAEGVSDLLRRRVAGCVLYSISGDPEFDVWSEPEVLAQHGSVPPLLRAG